MYGGARLKVWQVVVLGALWVALGVVLDLAIDWDAPRVVGRYYYSRRGASELFHALRLWLTGPVLVGIWHWYRAYEAYSAAKADESSTDLPVQTAAPAPPARPSAPLLAPPRIGDDPFRDPPAPPPIVVQRPPTAVAAATVVPGDPDDKPKLLT